MIQSKTCARCEQHLPHTEFSKDRHAKSGLCTYCKECVRARSGRVSRYREPAFRDQQGKTCLDCGEHKPWTGYYKNARSADGYQFYCKSCMLTRARGVKHPPERVRARNLLRYGLTPSQYDQILSAQNGCCAICLSPPLEGAHLHVDHDHGNSLVRGLLCNNCNLGLGKFRDDHRRLEKAIAYLQEPPALKVLLISA